MIEIRVDPTLQPGELRLMQGNRELLRVMNIGTAKGELDPRWKCRGCGHAWAGSHTAHNCPGEWKDSIPAALKPDQAPPNLEGFTAQCWAKLGEVEQKLEDAKRSAKEWETEANRRWKMIEALREENWTTKARVYDDATRDERRRIIVLLQDQDFMSPCFDLRAFLEPKS